MKILEYVKLASHSIRLLINPEGNIKSLIYLGDKIAESDSANILALKLLENPELQKMYDEGAGLEIIDLEALCLYPKDTLGYALYEFYIDQNLDVYPIGRFEYYSPSRYISERIRKVHDLLHVVFGYGTDLIGEAKVNSFVLNQSRQAISFLIIAAVGIKFLFKNPLQFNKLLREIESGWQMGYKAKFFLLQDWEELMKLPLDKVKSELISNQTNRIKVELRLAS